MTNVIFFMKDSITGTSANGGKGEKDEGKK